MRVCGVELKGGEAIICLLTHNKGAFNVPECRQRMFTVSSSMPTDNIREFQDDFEKLMEDYKIKEVVILERDQKGKHAGSATSFKLEAAIQLLNMRVATISSATVKEQIKRNPIQADVEELGLKKFQITAFKTAYAYLNQCIYLSGDGAD